MEIKLLHAVLRQQTLGLVCRACRHSSCSRRSSADAGHRRPAEGIPELTICLRDVNELALPQGSAGYRYRGLGDSLDGESSCRKNRIGCATAAENRAALAYVQKPEIRRELEVSLPPLMDGIADAVRHNQTTTGLAPRPERIVPNLADGRENGPADSTCYCTTRPRGRESRLCP